MSTEIPTKPANKSPDKQANSFDRFHPDMPQIPGVGALGTRTPPETVVSRRNQTRLAQIIGIAAATLLVCVAIVLWLKRAPRQVPEIPADQPAASEAQQLPTSPVTPNLASDGSVEAATADELARPWSAKKFVFFKPLTHESVNAMVVRLPGGILWAFALQEPYGRCELEYVTDLARLTDQYGFRSSHPMVANPCNGAIYDPLKLGSIGGNVWVRGEIVHGGGLRPPLSINVSPKGRAIIADRME